MDCTIFSELKCMYSILKWTLLKLCAASRVSSLIAELASAAVAEKGIVFEESVEDRLCAYSRAVAHFPTAVKEFKWRNGWFYSLSEKMILQGKPDPCPLHTAWLRELKIV
ncbi:hypothetical protein Nepgr_015973 [Nepenthes gracilis]|uniref:Uncharacterized protein n=1 Tax=Nepenthes gracilis TaxID=150966 RepID=A0AAD3SP79_NEPGR|nr:hypothetical protein Nepgr_015973 [Nepenthes gracilis]